MGCHPVLGNWMSRTVDPISIFQRCFLHRHRFSQCLVSSGDFVTTARLNHVSAGEAKLLIRPENPACDFAPRNSWLRNIHNRWILLWRSGKSASRFIVIWIANYPWPERLGVVYIREPSEYNSLQQCERLSRPGNALSPAPFTYAWA